MVVGEIIMLISLIAIIPTFIMLSMIGNASAYIMTPSNCNNIFDKYLDHAQKLLKLKRGEQSPWKTSGIVTSKVQVFSMRMLLVLWSLIPVAILALIIGFILLCCKTWFGLILLTIIGSIIGIYVVGRILLTFFIKISNPIKKIKKLIYKLTVIAEGE